MLLFQKKHARENKVIDLSALSPCRNVLQIYSERTNFIAKVSRSSLKNKTNEDSFANHGRDGYGNIRWIVQAFPDDISEIFFDNLYDDKRFDFGQVIMKKVKTKTKIKNNNSCLVTLDIDLNTGSDIFGPT